jgi:hypothetical protein
MAHYPMINRRMWGRSDAGKMFRRAASKEFSAPWTIVGMLAAFAGGTLLGMMSGKKAAMSKESGGMWHMRGHHHHGSGQSACREPHETAAPGAEGEKQDERNEGE